ncbi:MAG: TIGR01777 family oxidoreductase, partial [Verrucomicrobiota bacterium]
LCQRLSEKGYVVKTLGRNASSDAQWDLNAGTIDPRALTGVDCVVHLAGEPIAQRWTKQAKERIKESRAKSTALLTQAILKEEKRPDFICASGSNFYGYNRGGGLDESASSGEGFLAEVCRRWEGEAQPLIEAGVRTVFVRTGIVLSRFGGALAKMLPPFKAGAGGRIGTGKQLMSWISLPDLVEIYIRAIEDPDLSGPINAVVPEAVTNSKFTKDLGEVIGRPTIFPLPAFVVKTLFGEMGQETVLADVGLVPQRLRDAGFNWRLPILKEALEDCLKG